MDQILTSASTCFLTNGGQAGGKLTRSRRPSIQFMIRHLSSVFPSWSSTGGLWTLRWRTAEVFSPNTKAFWERFWWIWPTMRSRRAGRNGMSWVKTARRSLTNYRRHRHVIIIITIIIIIIIIISPHFHMIHFHFILQYNMFFCFCFLIFIICNHF